MVHGRVKMEGDTEQSSANQKDGSAAKITNQNSGNGAGENPANEKPAEESPSLTNERTEEKEKLSDINVEKNIQDGNDSDKGIEMKISSKETDSETAEDEKKAETKAKSSLNEKNATKGSNTEDDKKDEVNFNENRCSAEDGLPSGRHHNGTITEKGTKKKSKSPTKALPKKVSITEVALFNMPDFPDSDTRLPQKAEEQLRVMTHSKDNKRLKQWLRTHNWPVGHPIRTNLWQHMCKYMFKSSGNIYQEMVDDLFKDEFPDVLPLPAFVDPEHVPEYYLTQTGVYSVHMILIILEQLNPDVTFCPSLFPLAAVFLHFMEPADCFNCLYGMLRTTESRFMAQTNTAVDATHLVMRDLAKHHAKSAFSSVFKDTDGNVEPVFRNWIWWIFNDLPFPILVQVLDCYLFEGVKILYRVALAILILYHKHCVKLHGPHSPLLGANVTARLKHFCEEMPYSVEKIFKTAFGIRGLGRKELRKLQLRHEMYEKSQTIKMTRASSFARPASRASFSGPPTAYARSYSIPAPISAHKQAKTKGDMMSRDLDSSSSDSGTETLLTFEPVEHNVDLDLERSSSEESLQVKVTKTQPVASAAPDTSKPSTSKSSDTKLVKHVHYDIPPSSSDLDSETSVQGRQVTNDIQKEVKVKLVEKETFSKSKKEKKGKKSEKAQTQVDDTLHHETKEIAIGTHEDEVINKDEKIGVRSEEPVRTEIESESESSEEEERMVKHESVGTEDSLEDLESKRVTDRHKHLSKTNKLRTDDVVEHEHSFESKGIGTENDCEQPPRRVGGVDNVQNEGIQRSDVLDHSLENRESRTLNLIDHSVGTEDDLVQNFKSEGIGTSDYGDRSSRKQTVGSTNNSEHTVKFKSIGTSNDDDNIKTCDDHELGVKNKRTGTNDLGFSHLKGEKMSYDLSVKNKKIGTSNLDDSVGREVETSINHERSVKNKKIGTANEFHESVKSAGVGTSSGERSTRSKGIGTSADLDKKTHDMPGQRATSEEHQLHHGKAKSSHWFKGKTKTKDKTALSTWKEANETELNQEDTSLPSTSNPKGGHVEFGRSRSHGSAKVKATYRNLEELEEKTLSSATDSPTALTCAARGHSRYTERSQSHSCAKVKDKFTIKHEDHEDEYPATLTESQTGLTPSELHRYFHGRSRSHSSAKIKLKSHTWLDKDHEEDSSLADTEALTHFTSDKAKHRSWFGKSKSHGTKAKDTDRNESHAAIHQHDEDTTERSSSDSHVSPEPTKRRKLFGRSRSHHGAKHKDTHEREKHQYKVETTTRTVDAETSTSSGGGGPTFPYSRSRPHECDRVKATRRRTDQDEDDDDYAPSTPSDSETVLTASTPTNHSTASKSKKKSLRFHRAKLKVIAAFSFGRRSKSKKNIVTDFEPESSSSEAVVPKPRARSLTCLNIDEVHCYTLKHRDLLTLWAWIPSRYTISQPHLIYTTEEHGISLRTLYSRIAHHEPTLFVVKTTKNEIFGAYCSTDWRERVQKGQNKNLSYFGTGETFVFSLFPKKKVYHWVGLNQSEVPATAHMFLAGDHRALDIGGGNGTAIHLDEGLVHCRTDRCDTFDNEPLCSSKDFSCKVLEVFGFR